MRDCCAGDVVGICAAWRMGSKVVEKRDEHCADDRGGELDDNVEDAYKGMKASMPSVNPLG